MWHELLHYRPASLSLLVAVLCCAVQAADGRLLQRRSSSVDASTDKLPIVDGSEIVFKVYESRSPLAKTATQVLNELMFNVANQKMRPTVMKSFFSQLGLNEEVKLTPLRRGVVGAGGDRVKMKHVPLEESEAKKVTQGVAPAPAAPTYSEIPIPGSVHGEKVKDPRVKPPGAVSGLPRVVKSDGPAVDGDDKFRYRLLLHNPDLKAKAGVAVPGAPAPALVDPIAAFGPAAADEIAPTMQIASDAYDIEKSTGG